jgi:hypothetical protein
MLSVGPTRQGAGRVPPAGATQQGGGTVDKPPPPRLELAVDVARAGVEVETACRGLFLYSVGPAR